MFALEFRSFKETTEPNRGNKNIKKALRRQRKFQFDE
jgi:hypothetical protein